MTDPHSCTSAAGVGFKLDGQLGAQGIKTAADVRRLSRQQLVALLGERAGLMLYDMCRGRDSSAVRPAGPPKSITVEDSFKSCGGLVAARAVLQVRFLTLRRPAVLARHEMCRWHWHRPRTRLTRLKGVP